MKRQEAIIFMEQLSEKFNVPVPNIRFHPIKKSVVNESLVYIVRIEKVSEFITVGDFDGYHVISICESKRGVRKDNVIHEFFHYVDWIYGFKWQNGEDMEKSTERRSRKYMKGLPKKKYHTRWRND